MKLHATQTQADFVMLVVAFIWGTTFVIVKNALVDIGPFLFLGIRFLLAFVILSVFSFKSIRKIHWITLKEGSLLGFFLFIGYIFQTVGLQYTSSSHAGFITGLSVVLVPLIYAIVRRRAPDIFSMFIVILAAIGLYLLSMQVHGFELAYGDLLVLVCAFGFALHIVFVDKFSFKHDAVVISSVQILFVGILCILIGFWIEPWPAAFSKNALVAIAVTAVFATALAFLAQNALQKYSTPTRFAAVLAAEPVFAAIAGYLFAGEMLTYRGLLGGILILAAMLLAILKGSKNVTANV